MIVLLVYTVATVAIFGIIWTVCSGRCRSISHLEGYHVLVTGGSSGIGLALARLFHDAGASVTLVARDLTRLRVARDRLQANGTDRTDRVHLLPLDLCKDYSTIEQSLTAHVAKVGGRIDILINCAGYAVSRSFADTPVDAIDGLIRTNYLASVYVTRILLPCMLQSNSGSTVGPLDRRIVFVGSMASQVSVFGFSAYSASKYALRGFAEALRMELEPTGPMVTLAIPPDTDTPGLANENVGKPAATLEISSAGGLASPEHVAKTIFNDVLAGKLISASGLEGKALSWVTAGLLPPVSIADWSWRNNGFGLVVGAFCEILAAGPLRAFGIGYALWMRHVVSKHVDRHRIA